MRLEIVDVDNQLRTNSALWSAVKHHGRNKREEREMLGQIDDLLDLRLELMHERAQEVPEQSSHA
jgi:hypothetical protein